jgi:hypothetical protein
MVQARSPNIKYERVQEIDKKKKSERDFHSCYATVVNNAEGWSRISVEYERPNLKVFIFDHATQEFSHCFSMEIVLDYEGYFLISASAGDFNPYYSQVESFKLFDPKVFWKNNGEMARDRNAKGKQSLSEQINNRVNDLIHTRAVKSRDEILVTNSTSLMNQIAI